MLGLVHPNFLDDEYYVKKFRSKQYFITSEISKLSALAGWSDGSCQYVGDLTGWELLAVCRK